MFQFASKVSIKNNDVKIFILNGQKRKGKKKPMQYFAHFISKKLGCN